MGSMFDAWTARATKRVQTLAVDVSAARRSCGAWHSPPRTPDALNIAIAQSNGATLATFDEKMATIARALGIPVAAT
jgi:predicted nucleic acid-binding protein